MNDRAGQNRARPNRAGSVIFAEGSAEPARPISAKFDQNTGPKLTQITVFSECYLVETHNQIPIPIKHVIDIEIRY